MALTVETGAVVAGADSYISLADADTYFTNHGSPATWTGATDAAKEAALRYATKWLDATFDWRGSIVDTDQVLGWPRSDAYDDEGRSFATTAIPQALKDAECEAALEHLNQGLNVEFARGGQIKRQKVGPIETEYSDFAPARRSKDYIESILQPISEDFGLRIARA